MTDYRVRPNEILKKYLFNLSLTAERFYVFSYYAYIVYTAV